MSLIKHARRPLFASLFALFALGPILSAGADDDHWLVAATGSSDWFFSNEDDNVTYLGEGGENATFRLPMRKSAFEAGDVTIKLDSDAKGIGIRSGAARFSIKVGEKKDAQVVFRSKPAPAVLVNGKPDNTIRGRWIAVLKKEKSSHVHLEFKGATYVNLKVSGAAAKGGGAASAGAANIAEGASTTEMLNTIKRGVFQIQMFDSKDKPLGTGSGSLIHQDGFVLTNFHVVHGGSAAKVLHAASGELVKAEIWDADPKYDIALLKVDLKDFKTDDAAKKPIVLGISQKAPDAGNDCWAIGYPMGMGYTVTKGVINGMREFDDLPVALKRWAKYDTDSKWLQTDCTINPGNSGGPLINERGRIVGMNTWSITVGNNMYFALAAEHIQPFFDKKPEKALGWKEFKKKHGDYDGIRLPEDIPQIELTRKKSPAYVKKTLPAIKRYTILNCSKCNGTGQLVEYGRATRCYRCNGKGRSVNPNLRKIIDNVVRGMAEMDKEHRDSPLVLQDAYDALLENVGRNRPVLESLGKDVRAILAQKKVKSGSTIVARVLYLGEIPHPDIKKDAMVKFGVVLPGNKYVMLTDMVMEDEAQPGAPVLIGGLIAGKAIIVGDRGILVVQHGFMIDLLGHE